MTKRAERCAQITTSDDTIHIKKLAGHRSSRRAVPELASTGRLLHLSLSIAGHSDKHSNGRRPAAAPSHGRRRRRRPGPGQATEGPRREGAARRRARRPQARRGAARRGARRARVEAAEEAAAQGPEAHGPDEVRGARRGALDRLRRRRLPGLRGPGEGRGRRRHGGAPALPGAGEDVPRGRPRRVRLLALRAHGQGRLRRGAGRRAAPAVRRAPRDGLRARDAPGRRAGQH